VIRPREGWVIVVLDFVAQEVLIAAGLSGDPTLIEDAQHDPYLRFAARAAFASPSISTATARSSLRTPASSGWKASSRSGETSCTAAAHATRGRKSKMRGPRTPDLRRDRPTI
jgi:hypothetical protein